MQNVIPFNRESFGQLLSKKFLLVIVISIPSAIVADFFRVPLAWMIGPMIATSLIALKGFQVIMPRLALSSILIILGLHIGNYIDHDAHNSEHSRWRNFNELYYENDGWQWDSLSSMEKFENYRIKSDIEALDIGIDEILHSGDICFIEWPEKIRHLLPNNIIWSYIRVNEDNSRTLIVDI